MEQNKTIKPSKSKSQSASMVPVRVKRETKRRLLAELSKANKKDFGKKVRVDDLIYVLLPLLTDAHIKLLQENSMTNTDRLEIQYIDYVKKHGPTSKDDFLGKIISGNVSIYPMKTDVLSV